MSEHARRSGPLQLRRLVSFSQFMSVRVAVLKQTGHLVMFSARHPARTQNGASLIIPEALIAGRSFGALLLWTRSDPTCFERDIVCFSLA